MTKSPPHRIPAENEAWPAPSVGESVIVIRGPLGGLKGLLVEFKGESRVVLSVALLQRSITAEIDADWIRVANGPLDVKR